MGVSKGRVGNSCTEKMCTCGQQICKKLKDNRAVSTNICRPKPNTKRKLVSFSKCCRPGNKRHYDCQAKCMDYPCQKDVINMCKCPIKHECNCVKVRKPVCQSITGDGDSIVNDGDQKTQSVNCGEAYVPKSQTIFDQNLAAEDQAVHIQNADGLQPVYSNQYSINESARHIVLNLCIAINEQVRFKR